MNHPLHFTYWVKPKSILAGALPAQNCNEETSAILKALADEGIRVIISLTEREETDHHGNLLNRYIPLAKDLGMTVYPHPIQDMSVPSPVQTARILKRIEYCLKNGLPVYLHCWGGLGRTGVIVGCYLAEYGITEKENILETIDKLKMSSSLHIRSSPETEEQVEYILDWCINT